MMLAFGIPFVVHPIILLLGKAATLQHVHVGHLQIMAVLTLPCLR